jgi:phenylalanyl-tRNA synthetase beta chain
MLGIIAYGGAGNVRNAENFFTLKGIIEKLFEILGIENARFERGGGAYLHPGQKAVVSIDGEVIGEMGCTHPRVEKNFSLSCSAYLAEIDFNKLAAHTNNSRKYRPLPKFPIVPRDIAVVVDRNIEAQTVIDIINTAKTQVIVENAKVFDVYYPKEAGDKGIPEGKKSMAFSFELRSDERTLTDEDINRAVNTILKALKFRLDAVLRS